MTSTRRPRASTEAKRQRILDAAEEIILEQGYAAVSSRSVAGRAGIQPPHLHYYFTTIDDLFVGVLTRRAGRNVGRMAEVLDSPHPLQAWWTLASDQRGTALFVELLAAANHRPALRAEVGEIARQVREMQVERLTDLLPQYGVDPEEVPPVLVAAAMQGLAFGVVADQVAGYDTRADEAAAAMGRFVASLEERRTLR